MPKQLTRTLISISLCLCAVWAMAQANNEPTTQPTPKALTLNDCLSIALKHQTDVLVGEQSLIVSKAKKTQAQSDYYPQVSLQADTDVYNSNDDHNNNFNGTAINVTQNIYDGGLREANVARAKYSVAQTDATLSRTRQTTIYSVTKAYMDMLRAQQLKTVAEDQVKYTKEQVDMAKARVEAGDAAQVDLYPLEAKLASANVSLIAAKNSIRTTAIGLQMTMGLTPKNDFEISEMTMPKELLVPSYDDSLKMALAQRPEVHANAAEIGSAKSSVKTAKIYLYPRPVLSGQINQPFAGNNGDELYSITAAIAFDIFDGNNNRSAYKEAQSNLTSAKLRAAQTAKDITSDVQNAYVNLTNAQERMDASAISVTSAQRNFDAQNERYAQGLAVPLDLLNAQLDLTTAHSDAVQAQYDYLIALAQLNYAVGRQGGFSWE